MKLKLFTFTLLLMVVTNVIAGVNYMNGNYFIGYTDIVVPGGGEELLIKRIYNSKSAYLGWFGHGWGTEFETNLVVSADSSVVVYENGSGGETRFTPKGGGVSPEVAAKKIINEIKKKNKISEKVSKNMLKDLVGNAEKRRTFEKKFGITTALAVGTTLYSNQRGIQQLKKVKDGYVRTYNEGKIEHFNNNGKLTKVVEKSGYNINLEYDGKVLKSIKDSAAKQIFFSFYPSGRVKELWSKDNTKASYIYDDKNNLIKSTDVAKNVFEYKYDRNNQLATILYADKTKVTIVYDSKTQMVKKITDRNGKVIGFKYEKSKSKPDLHYWTTVTEKLPSGRTSDSRFEYEHARRPDGELYTKKIVSVVDKVKEETQYDDVCFLPEKIISGKDSTTFKYNDKCLLVTKNSSTGESVKIQYHPKFNKITRVDGKLSGSSYWTKFDYDSNANLSKAENNEGKAILLVYDSKSQITKMIDGNVDAKSGKRKVIRTLSFKYNAMGKPVEIALDKVGKITVDYDNFGDIKNVNPASNPQLTAQVTSAFNNLLDIVKLSGVDLSL